VFGSLYFVDLVARFSFVLADVYCVVALIFSVLAKRLAGKSIHKITYLVSSGKLNLNLINQLIDYVCCPVHDVYIYIYLWKIWYERLVLTITKGNKSNKKSSPGK